MHSKPFNNIAAPQPDATGDTDASTYLFDPDSEEMDLGNLFSGRLANIAALETASTTGAAALYTATRYGRRFILKGLRGQYRNDPVHTLALAKEFEIGMTLDHPNIRRTIGVDNLPELGQVILLEFIDGTTLENRLIESTLSPAEARSIACQLADALSYIHSKQILHRDLKPVNILITHQGSTAKIIDFSLADSATHVVLKKPAGSRSYMAPEMQRPDAAPATTAADIYSLGVIIRRMAAATSDAPLSALAGSCTHSDPASRPTATDLVKHLNALPASTSASKLTRILASPLLTYTLIIICAALVADILLTLL